VRERQSYIDADLRRAALAAGTQHSMIRSMKEETLVRHTVTMSQENSAGVGQRVGARGFSAYVDQAVADKLRYDSMLDLLAEMEEVNGPSDTTHVEQIVASLW